MVLAHQTNMQTKQMLRKIRRFKHFPLIIFLVLIIGASMANMVYADRFDEQINALQQKNAKNQSSVNLLQQQASSYQDAIDKLQTQISSLLGLISANQAKQADLQQQIIISQQKLDQQRKGLADDLKAIYVNGQMSTTEMLATSKSLTDFVDAETYRQTAQTKIQSTMAHIAKLQADLNDQKAQVETLLADQRQQEGQLASAKATQDNLLAMNQSQQSTYNQQISSNQAQIASLRQQQIAANLAGSKGIFYGSACDSSHGDTYPSPLCSSPQDSIVSQWGLYNRECVDYVAWKEFSTGHYVPYGLGNAGDWPSNVPQSWLTNNPQPGDAAVRPANPNLYFGSEQDVGHVMYIEAINGDGTMAISQYNASLNGTYSYVASRSMAGLKFIHFPTR